MSRILFRDQPPELQEYIIEEIDSAMDLLALALSSKYFHKMIVPHHIHFRRLRCYLQREDVWTFLLENPHLCARFRVLEIIRRSRLPISGSEHLILPWCLEKETRISSRTAPSETGTQRTATLDLVRAVCQSMPRLRFFKWVDEGGINPTPVQPLADILSAVVQSCPPLQSVEILPRLSTCMGYSSVTNVIAKNITQFAVSWPEISPRSIMPHHILLDILLHHCSHLQDLEVEVDDGTNAFRFLSALFGGNWPRLTRFTISTYLVIESHDSAFEGLSASFSQFIKNHETIERLFVVFPSLISSSHSDFSPLSKLLALGIPWSPNLGFVFHTTVPQNIEYLNFRSNILSMHLFSQLSSLHTVIMELDELGSGCMTLDSLPRNIRRINLLLREDIAEDASLVRICIDSLSKFEQLTHLGGLFAALPSLTISSLALPLLQRLVKLVPSIEYVELGGGVNGDLREGRLWHNVIKGDSPGEFQLAKNPQHFSIAKDEFFIPIYKDNLW